MEMGIVALCGLSRSPPDTLSATLPVTSPLLCLAPLALLTRHLSPSFCPPSCPPHWHSKPFVDCALSWALHGRDHMLCARYISCSFLVYSTAFQRHTCVAPVPSGPFFPSLNIWPVRHVDTPRQFLTYE